MKYVRVRQAKPVYGEKKVSLEPVPEEVSAAHINERSCCCTCFNDEARESYEFVSSVFMFICVPAGSESHNMLESAGSDFNWGCRAVFCYSRVAGGGVCTADGVDLLLSRSRDLELD